MSDPSPRPSTRRESASVGDVVEFVKDYAIQETVGPLKGAGRWIGYGAGGAALLGLGLMLVLLGTLRAIQSEWDGIAEGGTSWIPYAIVLILTAAIIYIAVRLINKTYLNKENR